MNWSTKNIDKIRELVTFAKDNSPFYSQWLKSFEVDTFNKESFLNLPIINKKDISSNERYLLTSPFSKNIYLENTSGSTGIPLKCYKGTAEKIKKSRDLWRFRNKNGMIKPNDLYVMFYAFTEDDFKTDKILLKDNVIYLSMFDMSTEVLNEYYEVLVKNKPKWILGVPSALQMLSEHIIKNNLSTENLSVQYIECNGEMLFDYQKQVIENAFGPIVYNHYGCREFWCLGMTCSEGKLHILEEEFLYEVINVNENGIGELVITDLFNKTWPLIRYNLGDLVKKDLGVCCCDNPNKVLKLMGGRTQEYLKIGDWIGNPILFHYAIIKVNKEFGNIISSFRVTQKTAIDLIMELVIGITSDFSFLENLESEISSRLPSEAKLMVKVVQKIEFTSNKFKYFIPYKEET